MLQTSFSVGSHIVHESSDGRRSEGFVTSGCHSPTIDRFIALALVERGFQRKGEVVTLFDDGKTCKARIVDSTFYDSRGERMNA